MKTRRTRKATLHRKTRETDILMSLNLDGTGESDISTTIPFLDHMLEAFAKHGRFDLTVRAKGDTHIDDHHLTEDLGIALGQAIGDALGEKKGIIRYGNFLLPMDEALSYVALDLCDRPYFVFNVRWKTHQLGKFDALLVEHFFESVAANARMNLHMALRYGKLSHHIAETLFKGFARALAEAVRIDPRVKGIPSTKGKL
jgi:imidazoleglycerol-phosphate dehydratase